MPTIKTTQDIEIDVEVFCATCGAGLCNQTEVKGHAYPQLRVEVCQSCLKDLESDKNKEIDELNEEISKIQQTLCLLINNTTSVRSVMIMQ